MSELQLSDYVQGLGLSAARVQSLADEVASLIAKEDLDGAALVMGVSDGRVAELVESWNGLRAALQDAGADWRAARDRGMRAAD